jgi:hypothetical protein
VVEVVAQDVGLVCPQVLRAVNLAWEVSEERLGVSAARRLGAAGDEGHAIPLSGVRGQATVLAPMLPDPPGAAPNQFGASSAIRPPRYLLLLLLLRASLIGWKRRRKGLAGNDGASDTRGKVQSGHGKVRSATSVVPRPVMVRILGWSAASANF